MATPNKLSPAQVQAIRRRYQAGEEPTRLAREYDVTRMTIYNQTRGVKREKQPLVKITTCLPPSDAAALREAAKERGISMSEAIALAVRGLLACRRG
jgi:hypothetical protein